MCLYDCAYMKNCKCQTISKNIRRNEATEINDNKPNLTVFTQDDVKVLTCKSKTAHTNK